MSIVIPDAWIETALSDSQVNVANWRIALFKNNYTPVAGTAWSDLTEADFSGYSRQTPSFPSPSIALSVASSAAPQVTFSHNGGATANNVYGWALIDTTGGTPTVICADRLASAPQIMSASGDFVKVTLTETVKQG